MSKKKSTGFDNNEYVKIVLQGLKIVAGRSPWLAQQILPRSTDRDTATPREVIDVLNYMLAVLQVYEECEVESEEQAKYDQIVPGWETAR